MNLKEEMVIINNKIVTKEISECKLDPNGKTYQVQYKNYNKVYHFSKNKIKYLQHPNLLILEDYNFYAHQKLLKNIKEIYEFSTMNESYYHVVFKNDSFCDYHQFELKKIRNSYHQTIDYLKDVSGVISLTLDDGNKILQNQMNKIEIDQLDSALANYLKLSEDLIKENRIEALIFPFGCNSSQYDAVTNAIYNKISVIEGPPGTGKTLIILNIIANIIIRDMNCQVVSNNNSAIENIDAKLKHYGLDFFEALLGRKKNQELFLEQQNKEIPNFKEHECMDLSEIHKSLINCSQSVRTFYDTKKELAHLNQKKQKLELEYRYFNELVKSQKLEFINFKYNHSSKLKLLWNEMVSIEQLSIWNKIKYIFFYKVGNFKFYQKDVNIILKSIQNQIYMNDLKEINTMIQAKETFIKDQQKIEEQFTQLSMDYLKKYLSIKYRGGKKIYSKTEMWKNGEEFLKDYPVILSTTYSSRNSFKGNLKFDYIIMDEASQIDVVTGTLALSSAKYAVIIGDEKQLPNVVPSDIAKKADHIFQEYSISKSYSYTLNSFLSSIKNTVSNVPIKMLVEHYRCHPKIIQFCNQKFYHNELVIMTEDHNEDDVIKIIKTKKGNHAREKSNMRQVDIIKAIISKDHSADIGVITPYNEQVNLVTETIDKVEVSTVHKIQGREKDTIIISTVEDHISEFVGDAKILNVAISRAKKHLYFIVTGNEIKNSNINDFIDYVDYNNMEIINSKIYSSFDLLYKQYELERLEFFKKHHRISKYDSENLIYYLINNIIKDYESLEFHFHQSLNDLIKDKSLLNEIERKYASHHNTHLDFYIFKKIGERPVLAIEVDGYRYHKKGTKQYERDQIKNEILKKYHIPLIRLQTNSSGEEKKIRDQLDQITNS